MLAYDVKEKGICGKHVGITLKTHKFQVKTKGQQLERYVSSEEEIYKIAQQLFEECWPCDPLRLIGIRLGELLAKNDLNKNSIDRWLV